MMKHLIIQQILKTEQDSVNFAYSLAKTLKAGDILLFNGNLGSGKTFICREIIKYFCGTGTNVTSPTFNLLQTYEAPNFVIYHYDLYRLKYAEEIYELGIEEALDNNLCLIEWPEIISGLFQTLPSGNSMININLKAINDGSRTVEMVASLG